MVLDLEIHTHFLHHFVVQLVALSVIIFQGNLYRQIISFLMNLTTTLLVTLAYEAASTHGEVVDRNQNKAMYFRSLGLNSPNHIYSPHGEWPRRCQDVQRHGWSIDIIRECLALVAFSHMDTTVIFHGEPVIPCP